MHPEQHDEFRAASFRDLTAATLYDILRLRSDVFVVEQECVYPDLDGRDTEPGTRHLWFSRDREIRAYLRILDDHGTERIGRVVTAKSARGSGLAGRLLGHALEIIGHRPAVLDAQSYLVGFYGKFGFEVSGPEFVEDGIPHTPMTRKI
ncbi:ElaA protein [Actinoplanes cyaneus]|uniref:ElaA protein n=1 Tax=Actinoplanes cyaneus TaxID=52696 RepID=A0A919IJU6_9ACTN|nr:GNAT family N-acetyltransferase [Actinoplanes cyaneus]MCW2140658.1 ElaA protein [Actinoplanes cyaneus]GID67380.1 ElaA protein [Actinoplanes cyaneus]